MGNESYVDNESYPGDSEKQNKEAKGKKRPKEYTMLNVMLFLTFVAPAAFALMVGLPMNHFYFLVIVWVHEIGRIFWSLTGSKFLGAFGGFLNEMLFTLIPALICLKERGAYMAGCILIMCVGMSIQHTGVYMQSAEHPEGTTSFAGALTGKYGDQTAETHEWSIIFGELGLIKNSNEIGKFTEEVGRGIAIIFLIISILSAGPVMSGWHPEKLTIFIGYGAIVAAIYFILSGASKTEIILALILSIPLLWAFITRRKTKPETTKQSIEPDEKEEKYGEATKKEENEEKETYKPDEMPELIKPEKS